MQVICWCVCGDRLPHKNISWYGLNDTTVVKGFCKTCGATYEYVYYGHLGSWTKAKEHFINELNQLICQK